MNHSIRVLRLVLVVACCCCYCISVASGADSLIVNGDFQKWTGDTLDGWDVEIGAKSGVGESKSEVKLITGPALMLRGDAATMAWHSVSQEIAVRPGSGYRLDFETRTKDVRQQGHQFNNCYVGVMFLDGNGKPVGAKPEMCLVTPRIGRSIKSISSFPRTLLRRKSLSFYRNRAR